MDNRIGGRARGFLVKLQAAELRLAALALILMMLVTVLDVTLRYLFNSPVRGSYDFTECMLIVFVFHGMPATFLTRSNIVIDALDGAMGPRLTGILIRVSDALTIATLLIMGWAMVRVAMQAFAYGDRKIELGLPVYILWIVAMAGLAVTLLCAIAALFDRPVPAIAEKSASE